VNIRGLKIFDHLVGRFFSASLPSASFRSYTALRHCLLIRPGGIGDAVLLAPAIYSLKSTYPHIRITILAEKRNTDVFPLIPGVDEVLCYDRPREFIRALKGRYDAVVDTEQWYRLSAVVARLIRSPVKIGFDTNERRRMFTQCVPYDQDYYESNNFLALLAPLGIDRQGAVGGASLSVPGPSLSRASQILQPLHSEPFVAIFPGSSIPEKRWDSGRFRRVAEILSAAGIRIVVVGGKEDRQQGELITGGGVGLNLAGSTSLSETAAVIQISSLLVSADSGVLHIAAGLGVPTVSLFGPGSADKWAPKGSRHIVIKRDLPCSPCIMFGNMARCRYDARCMQEITVDEVVNAVNLLLADVGADSTRCAENKRNVTRAVC
jgi:lipopolysaccharide heptosyltransferase II